MADDTPLADPVDSRRLIDADAIEVADSTGIRRAPLILVWGGFVALGIALAVDDGGSVWQRLVGCACAATFSYLMIASALHPPYRVDADSRGVEVRWGFRRLTEPVLLQWPELSVTLYTYRAREQITKLQIRSNDLRPAIARQTSMYVRLLLWTRQLTRRRVVVGITVLSARDDLTPTPASPPPHTAPQTPLHASSHP
jgi:hypothetical protein